MQRQQADRELRDTCMNAYQRMVTTENDRKLPSSGVIGHDTSDSFADLGDESRVFHLTDRWVVLLRDLFELVVSIKLYLPSQILELLLKASFNQVDGTVVDSEFSLTVTQRGSASELEHYRRERTWPPLDDTERRG